MGLKNQISRYLAVIFSVIVLGGCAVNSTTGKLGLNPAAEKKVAAAEKGITTTEKKVSHFFNNSDPCSDTSMHVGAILGGLAGGLIGYAQNHNGRDAIMGAIAGAGVGGIIGHSFD